MALDPSNFSATGTVHSLMHITVDIVNRGNGQENFWSSSDWTAESPTGTLHSGSTTIASGVTLRRLARWDRSGSDNRVILNSVEDTLGALFDQSTDPYRCTIVREVTGTNLITLGPPSGESSTRNFVDWRQNDGTLTSDQWTFYNAINSGDQILLVFHEGTASYTPASAPVFAVDTETVTHTIGSTFFRVDVPEATGSPTPTYAVVGDLPDGLEFDTTTRIISGHPTAATAGTGTITIRATNSEGSDDWTLSYTFNNPPAGVYSRNTLKDIDLGDGDWTAGFNNDNNIWFIDGFAPTGLDRIARAYDPETLARVSTADLTLGTVGTFHGGVAVGDTAWIVQDFSADALAYTISTDTTDSSKNIADAGTSDRALRGACTDNTTLWFVNVDESNNMILLRAFNATTLARDTSKDIDISQLTSNLGRIRGAVCDGTTIYVIISTFNEDIAAFNVSDLARNNSNDIAESSNIQGAAYYNDTIWFISDDDDEAEAWTNPPVEAVMQVSSGDTQIVTISIGDTEIPMVSVADMLVHG